MKLLLKEGIDQNIEITINENKYPLYINPNGVKQQYSVSSYDIILIINK